MAKADDGGKAERGRKRMTQAEQSAAFIEAARELGCDEDPDQFRATVHRIAKSGPQHRPARKPRSTRT